ncbi:unnamed protein product [Phaeothamnion confervicola]
MSLFRGRVNPVVVQTGRRLKVIDRHGALVDDHDLGGNVCAELLGEKLKLFAGDDDDALAFHFDSASAAREVAEDLASAGVAVSLLDASAGSAPTKATASPARSPAAAPPDLSREDVRRFVAELLFQEGFHRLVVDLGSFLSSVGGRLPVPQQDLPPQQPAQIALQQPPPPPLPSAGASASRTITVHGSLSAAGVLQSEGVTNGPGNDDAPGDGDGVATATNGDRGAGSGGRRGSRGCGSRKGRGGIGDASSSGRGVGRSSGGGGASGTTPGDDGATGSAKRRRCAPPSAEELAAVWRQIRAHDAAWPFLQPVDVDVYTDYVEIVGEPVG